MPRKLAAPAAELPRTAALYRADHQKDVINRLRRIEGQVRGVVEMIQENRSCEDVALQMSAVRKAMDKAFYRMMACTMIEAVSEAEDEQQAMDEIEKATRLLEKFS
jgi:DNA-binding FrmR family transcriptional regulator